MIKYRFFQSLRIKGGAVEQDTETGTLREIGANNNYVTVAPVSRPGNYKRIAETAGAYMSSLDGSGAVVVESPSPAILEI